VHLLVRKTLILSKCTVLQQKSRHIIFFYAFRRTSFPSSETLCLTVRFSTHQLAVNTWPDVLVDCVWNVMAHAQKPDFVFRPNGPVHLNRRGASVQSTAGSWGVRNSGSDAGYTMFRGSVKSTGYPLHSPVSLSLPLPCVTVCHHISTGL
jgi:hypothetical protein